MKKVGILTFHTAHNYGAVLQAYALQEYLRAMDCVVDIINYRPLYLRERYTLRTSYPKVQRSYTSKYPHILRLLKYYVTYPIAKYYFDLSRRGFEKFEKNMLTLSPASYNFPFKDNYDYDLYIVGSDQVWNLDITRGDDPIFWGSFDIKANAKKVSYAASSAWFENLDLVKEKLNNHLLNFTNVSVREEKLHSYLLEKFNVSSKIVLDPTLLVDKEIWNRMAIKPREERYLLVYTIGGSNNIYDYAKKIAKEKKLSIIRINYSYRVLKGYTPEEFVGLFKYAEYVVCSSFHGLAFSIIFNKQFCVVSQNENSDARAQYLLAILGVKKRLISNIEEISTETDKINYDLLSSKLSNLRKYSATYLNEIIASLEV